MNKQTQLALEYRFDLLAKVDSLESLHSVHDFIRGFLFALLSAQVISDSELDDLGDRMNSAVSEAYKRICQIDSQVVVDHQEESKDEEPDQVPVPAASSRLPVRSLCIAGFFARMHALHPRIWCPINVCRDLRAFGKLPAGWPPLPGKRPLVCGEGEVRLSSVQAAT